MWRSDDIRCTKDLFRWNDYACLCINTCEWVFVCSLGHCQIGSSLPPSYSCNCREHRGSRHSSVWALISTSSTLKWPAGINSIICSGNKRTMQLNSTLCMKDTHVGQEWLSRDHVDVSCDWWKHSWKCQILMYVLFYCIQSHLTPLPSSSSVAVGG